MPELYIELHMGQRIPLLWRDVWCLCDRASLIHYHKQTTGKQGEEELVTGRQHRRCFIPQAVNTV